MPVKGQAATKPKYQALFESLKTDIISGRYKAGQKLPSEAALVTKSVLLGPLSALSCTMVVATAGAVVSSE